MMSARVRRRPSVGKEITPGLRRPRPARAMLSGMSLEDEGVRGSGERAVAPGPVLGPPQGRGHRSAVRLTREWYAACRSAAPGGRGVGDGAAGAGPLPARLGRPPPAL